MRVQVALVLLCIVGAGCAPDALEGFERDASGNNVVMDMGSSNNSMTNNNSNNATVGPMFTMVADQFRARCASAFCHGASASNDLKVVQNETASDQQVFDAMMDDSMEPGGFVTANSPQNSPYLIRMQRAAEDADVMPPSGPLPAEEVQIVEDWINAGAKFTD